MKLILTGGVGVIVALPASKKVRDAAGAGAPVVAEFRTQGSVTFRIGQEVLHTSQADGTVTFTADAINKAVAAGNGDGTDVIFNLKGSGFVLSGKLSTESGVRP